jgi:hypothetical protein
MPASPTDELEDLSNVENLNDSNLASDTQADSGIQDASNTADSSTADQDAEKPSMLDAVKAALKPEGEQSSGSGDDKGAKEAADAATEGAKDPAKAEEEDDLGEVTDEELKGYNHRTRRRVKQLIGKAKAFEQELESLKPAAEQMSKISSFVQENNLSRENLNTLFDGAVKLKKGGLTDDDFRTGVEMMLAVNNDPARAYQLLTPLMLSLASLTGEVLSPELAAQVNAGQITEEAALEISRSRAGRVVQTHQQTEAEKRAEAEAEEQRKASLQTQGDAVGSAITNWEKSWKTSDPDHSHKYALWRDKMDVYIARIETGKEPLPDAATVIAKAEQFKKDVTSTLLKMRPSRQPIRTTPTGVGTSTGAKAAPGSLKEAITNVLQKGA